MSATFDPYHRWLGISPKDQPPDHYRLLGVDRFENDREVIRDAAERQMGHVRRYALGQHSDLSQRLLNELGAAKACLTDPQAKAAYDQRLKAAVPAARDVRPPVEPPPPVATEPAAALAKDVRLEPDSPSASDAAWLESLGGSSRQVSPTLTESSSGKSSPVPRAEIAPAGIPPLRPQPRHPLQPVLETLLPPRLDAWLASVAGPGRPHLRDLLRAGVVVSPLLAIGLVIVALLPLFGPAQTSRTETAAATGEHREQAAEAPLSKDDLAKSSPHVEPTGLPSEGPETDNGPAPEPQRTTAHPSREPLPAEKPADGEAPLKPDTPPPKPITPPEPLEQKPIAPPPLAVAPFSADEAKQHQQAWAHYLGLHVELTNSIDMKLAWIPPGEFPMGSPDNEMGRRGNEDSQRVRITKGFYLGVYEVMQAEYQRVTKANPSLYSPNTSSKKNVSGLDTGRWPVEGASGSDAVAFCRKLSDFAEEKGARRKYRLPTEAEWEYACRAGSTSPFHFGSALINGRDANCRGQDSYGTTQKGSELRRTKEVGSYAPNAWGLYDMHGNVAEFCSVLSATEDSPESTHAAAVVLRGGSWSCSPADCRSAVRPTYVPRVPTGDMGFRVVCECEVGDQQ